MTLLGRAKAKPDRNRVWGDEAAAEDPQRKEALGLKLQQFSATQQRGLGTPGAQGAEAGTEGSLCSWQSTHATTGFSSLPDSPNYFTHGSGLPVRRI